MSSLRKQVADVTKEAEMAQISRAEAINRLTRSLHDSQDQCNQLLESGQMVSTSSSSLLLFLILLSPPSSAPRAFYFSVLSQNSPAQNLLLLPA